jgi:DNA-binding NtrC family response regulator
VPKFIYKLNKIFRDRDHHMKNKNILLVDDEPEILAIFRIFLESAGYYVESAATAKEALEKISAKKFHLAVIDINLPDALGTELLEKINGIQPEMIKIIVTGDDIDEKFSKSFSKDVDAYIIKPVKKKILMSIIEQKIGNN